MKITINTTGRLNIDDLIEKGLALAKEKALAEANTKLSGTTCPEHGTIAEPYLVSEENGFNITVANICCPAFRELVVSKLRGQ